MPGYKDPPKHTQFKPGQSGNPEGRTRGFKSFKQRLKEEMDQHVTVVENGREVRLSKLDLLFKGMVNAGARGNVQAARQLFAMMDKMGLTKEIENKPDTSSETLSLIVERCTKLLWLRGDAKLYLALKPFRELHDKIDKLEARLAEATARAAEPENGGPPEAQALN